MLIFHIKQKTGIGNVSLVIELSKTIIVKMPVIVIDKPIKANSDSGLKNDCVKKETIDNEINKNKNRIINDNKTKKVDKIKKNKNKVKDEKKKDSFISFLKDAVIIVILFILVIQPLLDLSAKT